MKIKLRQEIPQDYQVVEKLVQVAFLNMKKSNQTEHHLVRRLRKSDAFVPALSIVAEYENQIVGHILLTKIKIKKETTSVESLVLAPVAVLPAFQNKGIGGQLIREAHRIARELKFKSVILVGHANYYPRFGYLKTVDFGIKQPFEVADENSMLIELIPNALKDVTGTVEYPNAFFG